jgi:hypothetical protein
LSDDVDLEVYSSPKKINMPMTNVLSNIASRQSLGNQSSTQKINKDSPLNRNFRASRYSIPVKKVKSSSRIGSLKRPKENINNAFSTNSSKESKRHGSVPKQLINSNSKFYKIYKQQSNDNSYVIKHQPSHEPNLNNSFPSVKNMNSASSVGVFKYPLANQNPKTQKKNMNIHKNITAAKRHANQGKTNQGIVAQMSNMNIENQSMSPMVKSQKIPHEFYDNHSRITSYENNRPHPQMTGSSANNMKLINTLNKSTMSTKQNKGFHSLGTLGMHMNPNNLYTDYENIEEMHGVIGAFYQVTNSMLHKVEAKEDNYDKRPDTNDNLLQMIEEDIDI